MNDIVKSFIVPYLTKEKERIVDSRCAELKNLNERLIINMNVGYTGARKCSVQRLWLGLGPDPCNILSHWDKFV